MEKGHFYENVITCGLKNKNDRFPYYYSNLNFFVGKQSISAHYGINIGFDRSTRECPSFLP